MVNSKKIMVVSAYAPPSNAGSGLMMWHLLSRFPENELTILTAEQNQNDVKHKLDVPYYYYGTPLTSFRFNDTNDTWQQKLRRIAKSFPLTQFFGQWFYAIRLIQRVVHVGSKAIEEQRPSMLIGYSDIGPALIGTYLLSKKYKLPFSLFFYDLYLGNKLPFVFALLARYFEPKIFQKAQHIFVMCDSLHELYKNRYKNENIHIIYNSTDVDKKPTTSHKPQRPIITYIGSIYWAQIEALRDLLTALPLVPEKPLLRLYTTHSKEYLNEMGIFDNDSVSFNTCAPNEVADVLNNSSLNFVGLSFKTQYPSLINTSSPGRLCELLHSNTPILVHAPKNSFLSQYAKENDFAYVSTVSNPYKLAELISKSLTKDPAKKIMNAHAILAKNHDPVNNARKYYDTLCTTAETK